MKQGHSASKELAEFFKERYGALFFNIFDKILFTFKIMHNDFDFNGIYYHNDL